MQRPSRCLSFFCLCIAYGCAQLGGQTHDYHVELSDGTSGEVFVVNDGGKPIEAYHFVSKCGSFETDSTVDILAAGGGLKVLLPGERKDANILLSPRSDGCTEEPALDAVILTDGSFEGDLHAVQALQAWRDGVVAGVRYWHDRLHHENATEAELATEEADAKLLAHEDLKRMTSPGCRNESVICAYWHGRRYADIQFKGNVVGVGVRKYGPEKIHMNLVNLADGLQKKIEDDEALKKLEITFPLPAELGDPAHASDSSAVPVVELKR
jgi:hypothetical protein